MPYSVDDLRTIIEAELHDAEIALCQPGPASRYAADATLARAIERCARVGDGYWESRLRVIRERLWRRDAAYDAKWGHPDDRTLRYHVSSEILALRSGMPIAD